MDIKLVGYHGIAHPRGAQQKDFGTLDSLCFLCARIYYFIQHLYIRVFQGGTDINLWPSHWIHLAKEDESIISQRWDFE
jgi:hypothetical protein